MTSSVIKVENVSKQYRLGLVGTGTFSHDVNRFWHQIRGKQNPYTKIGEENDRESKANSEYVWALKDISFEVQAGEILGIIGRNGAGKSTLLKIMSRTTSPTQGSVRMKGRVASLLEVGTGFHPDLTGRENVYLNGAILGMRKKEIDRKFEEIIDFAGVERYIDTPVKRYSSGMHVRLGFAVAAHLEPEILIVDEVLAVGDVEFQKKCLGKMQDVSSNQGRTVLFVSHNLSAIKELCAKSLLLQNGTLKFIGSTAKSLEMYTALSREKSAWHANNPNRSDAAIFSSIELKDATGRLADHFEPYESPYIKITYEILRSIKGFNVGFNLRDDLGTHIYASADTDNRPDLAGWREPGTYEVIAPLPLYNLNSGNYFIEVLMGEMNVRVIERHIISFSIRNENFIVGGERPGLLLSINEWNYSEDSLVTKIESNNGEL